MLKICWLQCMFVKCQYKQDSFSFFLCENPLGFNACRNEVNKVPQGRMVLGMCYQVFAVGGVVQTLQEIHRRYCLIRWKFKIQNHYKACSKVKNIKYCVSQKKGNPICQWDIFIATQFLIKLYAFIIKGHFLFFHLIPNTWWYLNAWLKRNNLNSCMSKSIAQNNSVELIMTKFRLANLL